MDKRIDWLPWGEEAFQKAKQEQKPVFLHIGFPSCHWCHVMERESFKDAEVAALLNESFICVDVDREQRPDVDAVYMAACQSMTGQGGWPLTALLTPSQKPFYIATYIPRDELLEILRDAKKQWARQRDKLASFGTRLGQAV
ncbi:MAG: thioredoxin domain-containing protein, partial [Firmicutes bacterium]|nr:thioredoxin domain-containing protein [Bacillota bacterium]